MATRERTKTRTYYELLGVTPSAPEEIIQAVWRAWMRTMRVHPDLGGNEEFAKAINAAYDTLSNPEKRAQYDAEISQEFAPENEVNRRAPRSRVEAEIAYCAKPDDGWLAAKVVDASALGMRVRTEKLMTVGQNIAIAFPEKPRHAYEAKVRWMRTSDDFSEWRCEAGLEFFSPIPDILHRLGYKRP